LFDLRELYFPRWTADIEKEFLRNWAQVVKRLKGSELKAYQAASPHCDDERKAQNRLSAYRNAVGDEYRLIGYNATRIAQQVPSAVNKDDTHVAQAAILMQNLIASEGLACDKVFLISTNVKHLAVADMGRLGIEVMRPGTFIDLLLQAAPDRMAEALKKTVSDLDDPPYTKSDLLGALRLHGAKATAKHFSKEWGVKPPSIKNRQL
jgi:hypothetical protein